MYPFSHIIVSADGRVPKCCSDFKIVDSMGNVNENSLVEIWNGAKFQAVRNHLCNGRREKLPETCAKCSEYGVKRPPDNIISKFIYWITL